MFKKLILLAALIAAPFTIGHAETFKTVTMSTSGVLQAGTTGYSMHIASGTIRIFSSTSVTVTNSLTMNSGSTMTANGLLTMPSASTATFAGAVNITSNFNVPSSSITLGVAGSTVIFNGAISGSTMAVSGRIQLPDGNISSANTNFVVGFSSFDATASSATTSASSFVFSNIATTTALHKSTNKIAMWANGTAANDTANDACDFGFFRDSTFISSANGEQRIRNPSAAVMQQSAFAIHWTDAPGDTSAHTYRVGFRAAVGGTCTINGVGTTDAPILMLEIGQ